MKFQLKLLILLNSFFVFSVNLFAPLYAVYVQKIDSAVYHIGGIWSFYILLAGFLTIFISRFENHKKYADYFLIVGFAFRIIGWFGYIFASSLLHLYLIQIFMALGESFGTPSFNFIYSSYLTKGEIAHDWGINSGINYIIMGAASFLGGMIVYLYGFHALFGAMIFFSSMSILLALKFRKSFLD